MTYLLALDAKAHDNLMLDENSGEIMKNLVDHLWKPTIENSYAINVIFNIVSDNQFKLAFTYQFTKDAWA